MSKIISGKFLFNNKIYPFYLEGQIVYIIGEPFEFALDFKDFDEIATLRGVTIDNKDILFLSCRFNNYLFRSKEFFTIRGYFISSDNIDNSCSFKFDQLTFYSDALNLFFSPQRAIDVDMDFNNWDGSIDIKVKPFNETNVSFDFDGVTCALNFSRYVRNIYDIDSIGKINAEFTYDFSDLMPPESVLSIICNYSTF